MSPPSYRLDTIAAQLIERLEGTRRAWVDRPDAAKEAVPRISAEAAAAWARECRAVMGDTAQAARLEREITDSFVPRYTRLAITQNAAEAKGYGVASSGIIARVLATACSIVISDVMVRVVREPFGLPFLVLPFFVLLFPEIRAAWLRRQYAAALQQVVDDLGRVQDAVDQLPETPTIAEVDPDGAAPRKPRRVEDIH